MARTWSWLFVLGVLGFVAASCGSMDDQATQELTPDAILQTDQLMRKQDVFLERARALLIEIESLRSGPAWTPVAQTVHASPTHRSSAFGLLTRQWEITGDGTYLKARRLLEQSEILERQRQMLLREWTAAMTEARSVIPEDQYNSQQLKALVGNTELFFEMNKMALSRFALDESGFLILIGQPGQGLAQSVSIAGRS